METEDYHSYTDELVRWSIADERVIGLVALGSMAGVDRAPDEWSDHDFWLVTRDGEAAGLRSDTDWLPRSTEVLVAFAETVHGRSVLYRNGHLAEYAVFDDRDLELARANAFRVLHDRCNLVDRMQRMADRTSAEAAGADPTGIDRTGAFLAQLTIGAARHGRGERLSANNVIRGSAARSLMSLLASFVEHDGNERLDNLDPTRRFERAYPVLGAQISEALDSSLLDCAQSLLAIARRELCHRVPAVDVAMLDAVQATIDRARSVRLGRSEQ